MAWISTLTQNGAELIASAFGATLNYTRLKLGAGSVGISELETQTDVTDYVKDFQLVGLGVSGSTSTVNARVDNYEITQETNLTQMGLFANISDEPDVLLMIYQTDTPSIIPPREQQEGWVFEPQLDVVVSNVANFTANIDWNAYAKISDIQNAGQGKVDKVAGMGLSTNDYTTADKNKLVGVEDGATATQIVQTTGESTTAVMSQRAVTEKFASSAIGFLKLKNFTINGEDVSLIDYDPAEWNPNFVLPYGATLENPTDTSVAALAIQEATDPITNASDTINVFIWDTENKVWEAASGSPITVESGFMFVAYPPGTPARDYYWNASSFKQMDAGAIDPSVFAPVSHIAEQLQSENGVHGIRYYQGKLQYWNNQGWGTVQTGAGIGIGTVDRLSINGEENGLVIAWKDPEDLTLQGIPVSKWASTTLVRNPSGYPDNIDDGTLVVTNTERNQYAEGYADIGLVNGETYYYRLFPASESGVHNTDSENTISGEAGYNPFKVPAEEWAYDDGTGNLSVFTKMPKFKISDVLPGSPNNDWHPAFKVNGEVMPFIYVMKYEAVVVGGKAYSKINTKPTVSINFDNAKAACEANGQGHHLITNAEWAALALWCKANGSQPTGNISTSASVASGSANPAYYHNNDLSGIENLCGNAWEWCGGMREVSGEIQIIPDNNAAVTGADHSTSSPLWKAIMPDGTLVAPGTAGTLKYNVSGAGTGTVPFGGISVATTITASTTDSNYVAPKFGNVTTSLSGEGIELLKALALFPTDTPENLKDDVFWNRNNGERLPSRGGSWSDGANAGVFALNLHHPRSSAAASIGFRAAFLPN